MSLQMVLQPFCVVLVAVHHHLAGAVDDRHAHTFVVVLGYVGHEGLAVEQPLAAQRVHHLIVVHLQPCVQYVYLVLLLPPVLVYAEA